MPCGVCVQSCFSILLKNLVQFAEESCLRQYQLGGILEALHKCWIVLLQIFDMVFECNWWFLNVSVIRLTSRFSCKSL